MSEFVKGVVADIHYIAQQITKETLARVRYENGERGALADANHYNDLGRERAAMLAIRLEEQCCTTPSRPSEEPKDLSTSAKAAGRAGTQPRAGEGVANDTLADPEE